MREIAIFALVVACVVFLVWAKPARIVEKPVYKERIVEKPKEKIVYVEKIVEVPVYIEKPVERIIRIPVYRDCRERDKLDSIIERMEARRRRR